ncbi:glycosyltransferase family 2 protein [Dyadobacter fermentans]|uniref:Glycosyl transferase family 2 n=1 Tax=Dyadobacter fermentans (strain ATCC 700827 / DSM 18053 / CIP 107007 / KCTC 52180 / NS114) TaxID=471854 RepID=C6W3V0_DYAFD|nr:glycosyltransferase family 2 protein [Dyadobacter fermentans]ACT95798.1 glycosyl transferase family 2 [Dyadobacter fermentans DSM 18053]
MNNNPLVSIAIPVYNREKLITETLESALSQTYPNFEVVVVDNQSTDNTWAILQEIARKDERVRIFQNETNVGPVRNWERCFNLAEGEYVKILWSDDLIESDFLSETMAVFAPDVAFVMTGYKEITSDGKVLEKSTYQQHTTISISKYRDEKLYINNISFPDSPGCAIFRKSDIVESLVIDIPNSDNLNFPRYGAGNDLLIFLLSTRNPSYSRIACVNKYLSKFKHHQESITTTNSTTLKIYYDWAKWYFIKNYYNQTKVKQQFKARILFNTYKYHYGQNLLKSIDGYVSVAFMAKKIMKITQRKLNS